VKWNTTRQLRGAFFSDARLSALNLVEFAGRSHNDIRPANIVKWDHSFCLVDFRMARSFVVSQEGTSFSPNIRSSGWHRSEKMMFFSVAHIAVTVFILSSEKRFDVGTVRKSTIWSNFQNVSRVNVASDKCHGGRIQREGLSPISLKQSERHRRRRRCYRTQSNHTRPQWLPSAFGQHFVHVLDQILD
jgi:hypothetical protein